MKTYNKLQLMLIMAYASMHNLDPEIAAVTWICKHAEEFRTMAEYHESKLR